MTTLRAGAPAATQVAMGSLPLVVTISHLPPDRGGTSGRPTLNSTIRHRNRQR